MKHEGNNRPFSKLSKLAVAIGVIAVFASPGPRAFAANDWSRFRGPDGAGILDDAGTPAELDPEKNLSWKVETGSGTSSPVVIGDRLFLTSYRDDQRSIHCLDASTGQARWTKSVTRQRQEVGTPPCGPATPTPAADQEHVYAFFPDSALVCFSHEGEERWRVDVGPFQSFHGIASSPIVAEGNVLLLIDQVGDSFLAAYDCRTGKETWKAPRLDGAIGAYTTPASHTTAQGQTEIVVAGPSEIVAYDPRNGDRRWTVEGMSNVPISVPVVGGNRIFVCEPSFNENPFKIDSLLPFDKDKNGKVSLDEVKSQLPLYRAVKRVDEVSGNGDGEVDADELDKAFRSFVGGGGLVSLRFEDPAPLKPNVEWTYRKTVPHVASMLYYRDVLYFVNDGGILSSVDPASGEILKRARLNHGSKYYSSPVAADGRIYLIDTEGKIAVVAAGREWKVLGTSELGESCYATPAIAGGSIFVRGESHLFSFRAKPRDSTD